MPRVGFDWTLIVVLTGVWAVLFARGVEDGLRTQRGQLRIGVSSAPSEQDYPTVIWDGLPAFDLKSGDALVEVEGVDLRGASALRFYDVATRAARERSCVHLVLVRDGARMETRDACLSPSRFWWIRFFASACLMATGVLLLLRAPGWHLARRSLFMFWFLALHDVVREVITGPAAAFDAMINAGVEVGTVALLVWTLQDFSSSARPVSRWQRLLPIGVASVNAAMYVVFYHLPRTFSASDALIFVASFLPVVASLGMLTRAYRRSSAFERRQIRWIVLGCYVMLVGFFIGVIGSLPGIFPRIFGFGTGQADVVLRLTWAISGLALPASMTGAILAARWLDVDRLISATASWTILGVALFGGALALVPRIAEESAPALGLTPAVAQWLLSLGLLLAAIPAHRALWPRIDQQLFQERHRRMAGLDLLLDEIGRCESLDELARMPAERIDTLLEPESLVLYTRAGSMLQPTLVRRAPQPAQLASDSMALRALERRGRPIAAGSAGLDSFDRAALETLCAELLVPIRGREGIAAVTCLGRKRSGDIYSGEEIARLAALGNRCSEVLLRLTATGAGFESGRPRQVCRREGDLWTIASHGKELRLRDIRGLHYLAMLLREPGREFAAIDLVRAASSPPLLSSPAFDSELRVVRRLGNAGPVLDVQAREQYRARAAELDAELAEAERCSDLARHHRATEEREALLSELESAARGRASDSERARVTVTKAIKIALERIAEAHPELGAHLAATVRRGYSCAYEPDPRSSSVWEV